MFYAALSRMRRALNPQLLPFHLFTLLFVALPFAIVLAKALTPFQNQPLSDNFAFVNRPLFNSIGRSITVALFTLLLVFAIGYPFAYLAANIRSRTRRTIVISFVTCPLWSSFFVKLIGLKSLFDLMYGELNSTRGLIYVVIGLVYINLPIAILTFYNGITQIPANVINASLDLGSTRMETLCRIIIPHTHKSILAVLFLTFLPSISCVTVADFMNRQSGSKMVAQMITDFFVSGSDGPGANRVSLLILVLCYMIVVVILAFRCLCLLLGRLMRRNA